jgi:hypothetical protein
MRRTSLYKRLSLYERSVTVPVYCEAAEQGYLPTPESEDLSQNFMTLKFNPRLSVYVSRCSQSPIFPFLLLASAYRTAALWEPSVFTRPFPSPSFRLLAPPSETA